MTTSVQASTATPRTHERQVPPLGGFNLTALKLEVRRVLRNRRTMMFILVFPSVFFFMFGLSSKAQAKETARLMNSVARTSATLTPRSAEISWNRRSTYSRI